MEETRHKTLALSELFVVAFCDSAGGRVPTSRGQRSRSAIAVAGQDELERVFVLKGWVAHCTTDELIEEIFATEMAWHPQIFGVDASGPQGPFYDALEREARDKNKRLKLERVVFTGDKNMRIESILQPLQAAGKLFVQPDMDDLAEEWKAFPNSHQKDLLDALSGAIKLFPRRPKREEAQEEINQYRRYLQGFKRLTPQEIERKITEALNVARRQAAAGSR